jgi:competence protein ComEC
MSKSRIFLILSLNFIFGIFCRSFFEINSVAIYFLLISAVILAAAFYRNKYILTASFAVFFFVFGYWIAEHKLADIEKANLNGEKISGKVIVAKEPLMKDKYQNVIVKTENNTKILLNANLYADLNYGDELNLECTLKIPENKDGEFDYKMYLAKDGIFYLCQNTSYQKTGENKGSRIYLEVLNFKNKLSDNINSVIPEPEAALANGLIFGGNSQLSKEVANNFSKTGLSHIVAVSGFNVAIIAEYLMLAGIFLGLWRKQAFWFAIAGIFLFVLSVGFPSSAIRAGVMGSLLLWAMKNGRLANSFNAIIFAAAVMLLLNPLLLRWDIGFQLSFLATLGITELSPFWENYLIRKNKIVSEIQEIIFLTISASIFVLPIILYNFQMLSIVSVAANVLVLPLIPLAMLLVFLTSVVSLIWAPLSIPFAWITFMPLKYIIEVVDYLAGLSWASVKVNTFSTEWLVIWYVILFGGIYAIKKFKIHLISNSPNKKGQIIK